MQTGNPNNDLRSQPGKGEDSRGYNDAGGGGAGWWGGFAGRGNNNGGAGGSSYISGADECIVSGTGYQFIGCETKAGSQDMPKPRPVEGESETETGHWGDGYARIRLVTTEQQ